MFKFVFLLSSIAVASATAAAAALATSAKASNTQLKGRHEVHPIVQHFKSFLADQVKEAKKQRKSGIDVNAVAAKDSVQKTLASADGWGDVGGTVTFVTETRTVMDDPAIGQWMMTDACGGNNGLVREGLRKFLMHGYDVDGVTAGDDNSAALKVTFGSYNGCFDIDADWNDDASSDKVMGTRMVKTDNKVMGMMCSSNFWQSEGCNDFLSDYTAVPFDSPKDENCPFDGFYGWDAVTCNWDGFVNYYDNSPDMDLGLDQMTVVQYLSPDCSEGTEVYFKTWAIGVCNSKGVDDDDDGDDYLGGDDYMINPDGSLTYCFGDDVYDTEYFKGKDNNKKFGICQRGYGDDDEKLYSYKTTLKYAEPKTAEYTVMEKVSISALVLGVVLGTFGLIIYGYSILVTNPTKNVPVVEMATV